MEETNAISDYTTLMEIHASYLNFPLGKPECAGGLHDGRNLGIYRTRVAEQGGLQHPHRLGVLELRMVTGECPCQPTYKNEFCPGVLLFAIGEVPGQGGNYTSQRE